MIQIFDDGVLLAEFKNGLLDFQATEEDDLQELFELIVDESGQKPQHGNPEKNIAIFFEQAGFDVEVTPEPEDAHADY